MNTKARSPKTLVEAIRYYADLDRCQAVMVETRWPNGVTCPTCGAAVTRYTATRRLWECKEQHPRRQFSVKVGTIFEDSALGLDKWLPAVWMIANCKNGVSSHELALALDVTQKTAWFMLHRIRMAMKFDKMSGEVEADETFVGGAARFMHKSKKAARARGRFCGMMGKTAVMGLLDRHGPDGHSRVHVTVVGTTKRGPLQAQVRANVELGAYLYTDAHPSYEGLAADYTYKVVDHAEEYVRGRVHTNGLENYWSLLKRAIKGIYVAVEPFHLHRYVDEQAFRYNTRKDAQGDSGRFLTTLGRTVGRRITYKKLTGKPATA